MRLGEELSTPPRGAFNRLQRGRLDSRRTCNARKAARPRFSSPVFLKLRKIKSPNSGSRTPRNLQKTKDGKPTKSPKNSEMGVRVFDAFLCTCNQEISFGGFVDTPEGGCYIASPTFVGAH